MSLTTPQSPERSRSKGSTAKVAAAPAAGVTSDHHAEALSASDDAISKLAYDKFIARGCAHGHDEEDWAAAKRDLSIVSSGT